MWTHADEVIAAEDAAALAASRPLRQALADLRREFTLRWRRELGGYNRLERTGSAFLAFLADLAQAIGLVSADEPSRLLVEAARKARMLGVRQAIAEVGVTPRVAILPPIVDMDAVRAADDAAAQAGERLRKAATLTRTYRRGSWPTVRGVLAVADSATAHVEGVARTLVNTAVADGTADVATALGARLLWIAERDACVVCLALSGHLSDGDGLFDSNASFGKRMAWIPPGGLDGPPRHPRCRCRVTPWLDGDLAERIPRQRGSALTDPNFAQALRREAERSILNGWALPSEPTSVRAQAAQRLLDRITDGIAPSGWQVPKRVRRDAEKDLSAGKFRKRAFPDG